MEMALFRCLLFFIVFSWTAIPSIAFGNDLNYALQQKKNGLPVVSDLWMVSAANPYAVHAGAKILAQGSHPSLWACALRVPLHRGL